MSEETPPAPETQADAAPSAQEKKPEAFAACEFPVRSMPDMPVSHYRVYPAAGKCVTVEASTAAEAFRLSGVPDPSRIVREISGRQTLLDRQALLH